ncbi:hypothetical protein Zmor_000126 [Zophobas morio]|uniref:Beta-galactosidase n=1 Tax=Zophobas morio TaxID=2755281 RepID=A0AA38IYR1_9CUCU|nr:hypothetical protein Zmor_000126 [Zophobas morio]
MKTKFSTLAFQLFLAFASSADLPTLYQYYTSDGITSGLSVDQPYFTLNGKNITLYSGEMHYFRIPPQYWRDRLRKLRAAGLNTVATYIPWNLHEPRNGSFDFGSGGSDMEMFLDLEGFLAAAQEEDVLVIARSGPYICAEWEWGGFPSWLLRDENVKVRTSEETFMRYVERYLSTLLSLLAKYQFTNGGPIVAFQVENEYGNSPTNDKVYLQQLYDIFKHYGIVELLVTADSPKRGTAGTLPGVLFQTANYGSYPVELLGALEEMQPGQPLMAMEFYSGWFDHWSESHHTKSDGSVRRDYEASLTYPASVNLYMFHGGTNWGFLNGATIGPGDNSGLAPTTSSYDYNAPLTEAGDYTSKYDMIKGLIEQYNPIQTLTPEPPALIERQAYPAVPIHSQLSLNDILSKFDDSIPSSTTLSMEQLPINDNSGQSYGYIVYRQEGLTISADSTLTITGHVRDTVMILVDGVLISNSLSSSDDFNNFGYWRLENSTISLTSTDLTDATLDIVIENWGRGNSGHMYRQVKGLVEDNHVYLNGQELSSWLIFPLEFKSSWTKKLTGWSSVDSTSLSKGPGLYKATLSVDEDRTDTFLDMSEWNKGVVIVNGFVLGRYAFIGPQQTLYLPGPFLQPGDNEIVIFEHFEPAAEVKFSQDAIFNNL